MYVDLSLYSEEDRYRILGFQIVAGDASSYPDRARVLSRLDELIDLFENQGAAAEDMHAMCIDMYNDYADDDDDDDDQDDAREGFSLATYAANIEDEYANGDVVEDVYSGGDNTNNDNPDDNDDIGNGNGGGGGSGVNLVQMSDVKLDPLQLNPLLKQTATRMIMIDSQYRTTTYSGTGVEVGGSNISMTTDFGIHLTEPVRNVVSLKLYSMQMSVNWWTITSAYGSNFFYLKGNSPGIDDGLHDYKLSISAGYYSATTLNEAINAAITDDLIPSATDADFTGTAVSYDTNSNWQSMSVHVRKYYNETDYFLQFPTNVQTDLTQSFYTIPDFLGLSGTTSIPFTHVFSSGGVAAQNSSDNQAIYYVTDTNKSFVMKQYVTSLPPVGDEEYGAYTIYTPYLDGSTTNGRTSTILATYTVSLTLTSEKYYTAYAIYTNLQSVLSSHPNLNGTYSTITQTQREVVISTASTITQLFYDMTLKLNRMSTINAPNMKCFVEFPDELAAAQTRAQSGLAADIAISQVLAQRRIWTGCTSVNASGGTSLGDGVTLTGPTAVVPDTTNVTSTLFQFPARRIEIGVWHALASPNLTSYDVPDSIPLMVVCTKPYYSESALNNVIGTVTGGTGILITEYMVRLNAALSAMNASTQDDYNPSGIFNMGQTLAYYDTHTLTCNFQFDINKQFTRSSFTMNVKGSILDTVFNWYEPAFNNNDLSVTNEWNAQNKYVIDLSGNASTQGECVNMSFYVVDTTNNLLSVSAKSGGANSALPTIQLRIPVGQYDNVDSLSKAIQTTFTSYLDDDGDAIFNGTTCTYKVISGTRSATVQLFLTVQLTKTLTERDYKVVFYDTTTSVSASAWNDQLKLNPSYILRDYEVVVNTSTVLRYAAFAGNARMDFANFQVDENNDSFWIVPYASGVYGSASLQFTFPHGAYSNTQLIAMMNTLLNANAMTVGSSVQLDPWTGYLQVRIYLTKTYSTKDYRLVFYDRDSFVQCNLGVAGTLNATYDTTLGWYLGYHSSSSYALDDTQWSSSMAARNNYTYDASTDIVTIRADVALNINNMNYVVITVDDYNNSVMNSSLVTIGGNDISLPDSQYRTYYKCLTDLDPSYFNLNPLTNNHYTQKQLYAIQQTGSTLAAAQEVQSQRTAGPDRRNIFAIVPLKLGGVSVGDTYSDFSGPLQLNAREYSGPVNIDRLHVQVFTDKGVLLDLNGRDFTMTLLAEVMMSSSPEASLSS